VSSAVNAEGLPARLLPLVADGRFTLLLSTPLVDELADVLSRRKIAHRYRFTSEKAAAFLAELRRLAEWVEITGEVNVCGDPDDDALIETAERGQAVYVVSGDLHMRQEVVLDYLRARGIRVLTVREFLAELDDVR